VNKTTNKFTIVNMLFLRIMKQLCNDHKAWFIDI